MSFKVKVDIDNNKILRKINNKSNWAEIGSVAQMYMNPYVPARDLNLAGSAYVTSTAKNAIVEYNQPYAHNMYDNNYNFRKNKHPKATMHWDKYSIALGGGQNAKFIRQVNRVMKESL